MAAAGLKKRLRFTPEDDLCLLREVIRQNPFEDTARWEVIRATTVEVTGKNFSQRSLKEHVEYLLKLFVHEYARRRQSGTNEQINEKNELMQNLKELVSKFKRSKPARKEDCRSQSQENTSFSSYSNDASYLVFDEGEAAMDEEYDEEEEEEKPNIDFESYMPHSSNSTVARPEVAAIYDPLLEHHNQSEFLNVDTIKTEHEEKSDTSYMPNPCTSINPGYSRASVHSESLASNSGPSGESAMQGSQQSKKRRMEMMSITELLRRQTEAELELKKLQIELETKRLALKERKLALEEERFEIEKQQRLQRLELEKQLLLRFMDDQD